MCGFGSYGVANFLYDGSRLASTISPSDRLVGSTYLLLSIFSFIFLFEASSLSRIDEFRVCGGGGGVFVVVLCTSVSSVAGGMPVDVWWSGSVIM